MPVHMAVESQLKSVSPHITNHKGRASPSTHEICCVFVMNPGKLRGCCGRLVSISNCSVVMRLLLVSKISFQRSITLCVPLWYIVFQAMSLPSPWSSSYRLNHKCLTPRICWCFPLDVRPPPDLILVCSPGCIFNCRLIYSSLI